MVQHLREVRERLADLIPKLHEANERCIQSAKPLATLDELNLAQRQELAKSIVAACQDWEEVTIVIQKTIAPLESIGSGAQDRRSEGGH